MRRSEGVYAHAIRSQGLTEGVYAHADLRKHNCGVDSSTA